jgi:aspartate 1-decarboxylase
MLITVLSSKIHRARVTEADLNYEGSCAIGYDLLARSLIREYQKIDIYNVTTGDRFTTYAIQSSKLGEISVRGAAARKVQVGDIVIIVTIAAYSQVEDEQAVGWHYTPKVVYVDYDSGENKNMLRVSDDNK